MADKSEAMRKRFRKIMADNKLDSKAAASLTGYRPQTIRAFMCGAREIKPRAMKSLENGLIANK